MAGLDVCVVAILFRPDRTGSAALNNMFVDTLVRSGANVHLVTGVPHYPEWAVTDSHYRRGLRWHEGDDRLRVTRVRHAVPPRPGVIGRLRLEASFAALSAPYVRASKASVIVAITPPVGAMLAAQVGRRGRPVGVIVHDLSGNAAVQSGTAGGKLAGAIGKTEYGLLARADKVGVITRRFVPDITSNGVAAERISEVPIASQFESAGLTPAEARRALGWEEGRRTIVHTGNIGMKQGLEHVLAAARAAQSAGTDVSFVFVGDGNQRSELERQSADLRNVRFLGLVPDDQYPTVLAAADILLLHERPGVQQMSLPSKLTSYVTARRPILAAVDAAGITHSLLESHGAAMTVPSGNVTALLDAIDVLHSDGARAEDVIAGAQRMAAAEFSTEQAGSAIRRFVRELASPGSG
ncbi:glycosyltransferase family 4 protein [Mycobacterium sp. CPCC 205372]|uniref:Glycosyltransferase family 4 protein n=1 Tax=Mycobacterium hippophais TaxID=3016340 RepID=A0ABT4PRU4_9MYCO|nr:glycosyltransferase family 4 protein [Mycobacterium hippophais]MCZ8379278.1 glycosyltransferase family 4 protein [Mycobacterium hippophais]